MDVCDLTAEYEDYKPLAQHLFKTSHSAFEAWSLALLRRASRFRASRFHFLAEFARPNLGWLGLAPLPRTRPVGGNVETLGERL